MNDKSLIKVVCRVITLLQYIFTVCLLFAESNIILSTTEFSFLSKKDIIFTNNLILVLICTIPLIVVMIFSLIIKYTMKNKSKLSVYRITDMITRFIFTIPTTAILTYYVQTKMDLEIIIGFVIGLAIFILLNAIIRFTIQETMEVTFVIHDNL